MVGDTRFDEILLGGLCGFHRFIFSLSLSGKEISAKGRGGIGSSRRLLFVTKFRAPPLSASLSAGERGSYNEIPQMPEGIANDLRQIYNTFPDAPNMFHSSASLKHTHCYMD